MRLVLIDGMAVMHRAYHAYPKLNAPGGEVVNAVYGFSAILLKVIEVLKPSHVAVATDLKGKTFRHQLYKDYKGTRKKMDDDLAKQIPKVYEVVETFNIPLIAKKGFEADDVLATVVDRVVLGRGDEIYIVTGDMDILQLVQPRVYVYAARSGKENNVIIDRAGVIKKFGVEPEQVVDYKALVGDSSDNIKGVAGIGPKTAVKLLRKYSSLAEIYERVDELDERVGEKLMQGKKSAFLSYRLAQIVHDVPLEFRLADCRIPDFNRERVVELFATYGFKSLIKKLSSTHELKPEQIGESEQTSLF